MANQVVTINTQKKEEVLMPKDAKELLKALYILRSYSGYEDPMRAFLANFLTEHNIPFVNYNGNILGFNHPGAPLFSAHMDMVNTEGYKLRSNETSVEEGVFTLDDKTNIRLYRDKEKKNQTSLGADDKNGIWVILMLLLDGKKINFAFCHSEESGGNGSTQVASDKECGEFISKCQYGIIIDRRNKGDIIGYNNSYCLALDDRLEAFSDEMKYGFKKARGSISDADRFSTLIECVNLSCGYYEPHTSREYTNLNELWNTYNFCFDMLDHFQYQSVSAERMQEFKKCNSPYSKYKPTYTSSSYTGNTYYNSSYTSSTWDKYKSYCKKDDSESEKQKKISEEKTSMKTGKAATTTRDTTTTTTIDEEDLANSIQAYYADEAIEEGAVYSLELDAYLIPLFNVNDKLPDKLNRQELLYMDKCSKDGIELGLFQYSIDTLYVESYNKNVDKAYGFCVKCGRIVDLTKIVKYLM